MRVVCCACRRVLTALAATVMLLALNVAPVGTAPAIAATRGASAVSAQLATALRIAAATARHHAPPASTLRHVASLARQLLHDTADPSQGCRTAIAVAEGLASERRHNRELTRDIKIASHAPKSCVTSSPKPSPKPPAPNPTPAPTPIPPVAPVYVGGTVVDANGNPAAGVTVTIDVEFVIGVSGENDTATTTSNGRFDFTDLPASDAQPSWKFLDPTASFYGMATKRFLTSPRSRPAIPRACDFN